MKGPIQLRLCSRLLAEAYPFDRIERGKDRAWYRKRYGTSFGHALADALAEKRPMTPEALLLFPRGVEFANPDQIAWAIHVCGMVDCIAGNVPDAADQISAFAAGSKPFDAVPEPLRGLGVYAIVEQRSAIAFSRWIGGLDMEAVREEAADLHGAEWVDSIVAVIQDLGGIFGSVQIHGGDIAAWRGEA